MHMDELKKQKIWFCWSYEVRNGKMTKVPRSAFGTATGTSAEYAHTWVTYPEAAASAKVQGASGVGFKIPDRYFFLDIDHKDVSDPYVQLMLERFNSYTERSVSGGGIHIYGRCDASRLPTYTDKDGKPRLDRAYYTKNPNNDTELYSGALTNRFAVYTGDVIRDVPLRDCTDALLLTLEKDMHRKTKEWYSEKRDGSDKALFDIVCNLRKQKNGEKFCRLYDDGGYSDFGSQSEADCALCAMIAFRAGPDPAMIDTVFQSSALYREKWERDDYPCLTSPAPRFTVVEVFPCSSQSAHCFASARIACCSLGFRLASSLTGCASAPPLFWFAIAITLVMVCLHIR